MHKQFRKLLVNFLSLYIMVTVFPSVEASGITQIITFGLVLWLISFLLRPLLLLITIPINILTLGVFSLVVNTWIIMLADAMIKGVHIPGFWLSFLLAILIRVLDSVFKNIVKPLRN
ncbi:MAG: phage holin family protein [Bacillota bacterium]